MRLPGSSGVFRPHVQTQPAKRQRGKKKKIITECLYVLGLVMNKTSNPSHMQQRARLVQMLAQDLIHFGVVLQKNIE